MSIKEFAKEKNESESSGSSRSLALHEVAGRVARSLSELDEVRDGVRMKPHTEAALNPRSDGYQRASVTTSA